MRRVRLNKTTLISSSLIVLQCLIFGFSFVVVRNILDVGLPPLLLVALRFATGAGFLFLISKLLNLSKIHKKHYGHHGRINTNELKYGSAAGVLLVIAYSIQTYGANMTTPAKNGLFTDLFVIFVPIISMCISKKFKWQPLIASALALFGVMLILNIFSEEVSFSWGDALSIVCGLMFAIHFLVLDKSANTMQLKNQKINSYNFTIIQLAVVALISLVLSLCFEMKSYQNVEWGKAMLGIVFLGTFSTSIAYMLQFFAQTKISPETTAVVSCSESIFTLIFSLVFGYDEFSWQFILGAVILILGMFVATVTVNKQEKYTDEDI